MNDKTTELYAAACLYARDNQLDRKPEDKDVPEFVKCMSEKFAELMIAEFSDVVKTTANELAEHYTREGCSEEEVLMRVNGALVVLGHIRARFKD